MNFYCAIIITCFITVTTCASASEHKPAENLASLVEIALTNNPELKSAKARWEMFTGRVRQAGSLDDPMVMFKLQNLVARKPFSTGGDDPATAKVIGISQQLPFWGKRALKEDVAHYEAEAYRWQIEERTLELRRMVSETYYQLYTVDKTLETVAKNIRILDDFAVIAESRYAVGQGAQQDIFKARLEQSKMLDMQITLQQQRKSLTATLNYLLFRPAETPVGDIGDFTLPEIPGSPEQLLDIAREKRPQLKSLSMQVRKSQAAHRLADKEFWPDTNVSFEYMFRQAAMGDPGYNMFTLGITVNLPFQQAKRRAMLAESHAETTMASEEVNGLANTIAYTINDSLAQLERRKKLVELYRTGIIPQAEQSLESALISYRVGKVDFLTLLDARISLFTYERELYESKAEYLMTLARLEAAVGTDLARIQGDSQWH